MTWNYEPKQTFSSKLLFSLDILLQQQKLQQGSHSTPTVFFQCVPFFPRQPHNTVATPPTHSHPRMTF